MPRMSAGGDETAAVAASSAAVPSASLPTISASSSGTGLALERCAQCNKTSSVPLLAPDEPVGQPSTASPHNKPRYCNSCMIGKKVRVFWPVDESWYTGLVHEYDPSSGEHLLRYEDGDSEWVRIGAGNDPPPTPGDVGISKSASQPPAHISPESYDEMARQPHGVYYAPGRVGGPPQHYHGSPVMATYYQSGQSSHPPMATTPYRENPMMNRAPGGPEAIRSSPTDLREPNSSPVGRTGKKGPKAWSKHEDATLLKIVQSMSMPMRWSVVAQSLPDRTGKQCRERYVNHLNPRLKTTDWSPTEDATIFHLYNTMGSHWSTMSKVIPGRTDNGIKNRFHNLKRQLEREDGHRLRLSNESEFPDQIRLETIRKFPRHLQGKADDLWDLEASIGILSAQSVLGNASTGSNSSSKNFFGPFKTPKDSSEQCVRCGFYVPSVQTGREVCTKTGWCLACSRIPPHLSGNLLRECLNLRRCDDDPEQQTTIESWPCPPKQVWVDDSVGRRSDPELAEYHQQQHGL